MFEKFRRRWKRRFKAMSYLSLYAGFGQFWSINSKKYYMIAVALTSIEPEEFAKIQEYCKDNNCKLGIDNVFYNKKINAYDHNEIIGKSAIFILTKDHDKHLYNQLVWGDTENKIINELNVFKGI